MGIESAETEAAGTMERRDSELLAQYRRGEVSALEQLVEKYRRPLFGFILNMTEGQADADEIFQEVWFRAIRAIRMPTAACMEAPPKSARKLLAG